MAETWGSRTTAVRIGDIRVDLRHRRLEVDGEIVEIPPRVFDLFLLFLAEPNVTHTRESLFKRIWPGVVVEEGSLTQSIWLLRRALGEERKHCIRTVSRTGYVFEAWTGIVPEMHPDPPVSVSAADTGATSLPSSIESSTSAPSTSTWSPAGSPPPLRAPQIKRRRIAVAGLILLLIAIASGVWLLSSRAPRQASDDASAVAVSSVGVIMLQPSVSDPDTAKAGVLLQDWIQFRLWGFPEVLVLSEDDLADDASYAPDHLVLLTTGRVTGGNGHIFLRATFGPPGVRASEPRIERRGPPERLPQMIEAIAADVVARVSPGRQAEPMPLYALGNGAVDYAEGLRAMKTRDWRMAAAALRTAMQSSPRAGIIRLRLASVLAEQGEVRLATEQLVAARSMFGPLPADTETLIELLRDRSLATADSDFSRLAARYQSLAKRHPGRIDYALEAAKLQVSGGRLQETLPLLSQSEWALQPFRIRVEAGLLRCHAQLNLGHYDLAERCAQEMVRLTEAAGKRALWLQGRAESLYALARYNRNPDRADFDLFERAARTFESGQYAVDALQIRARAKLMRASSSAEALSGQEPLLAEARRNGLRGLEVLLLRDLARRSVELGMDADYRRHLAAAEGVAATAGDGASLRELSLESLMDDHRRGDIAAVERRIADLQRMRLGGEQAMVLAVMTCYLRLEQGRPTEARAALQRGVDAVTDDGRLVAPPLAAGMLGYARAHVAMHEGRLDEAAEALEAARRGMPEYYGWTLDFSEASLALMHGDIARTRSRIEQGLASLQGIDDAQTQRQGKINAAFLLTRVGEAKRAETLYEELLPTVTEAGDVYLRTYVLIGLAEVAASRRQWAASRRHAHAAVASQLTAAWVLSSRLSLLELAEALDRGDTVRAQTLFRTLAAGAAKADDHLVGSALALLLRHFPAQHRIAAPSAIVAPHYRYEAAWLADAVHAPAVERSSLVE